MPESTHYCCYGISISSELLSRRIKPLFFVCLLLWLIPACTNFYMADEDLPTQLNTWIKTHEYDQAFALLKEINRSHPDYSRIRSKARKVKNSAQNWEKQQLRKLNRLANKGYLKEAEQGYSDALSKYSASSKLQSSHKKVQQQIERELASIHQDLYLGRAKQLLQERVQLKRMQAISDDYIYTTKLRDAESGLKEARRGLMQCGRHALNQNSLVQAKQCYSLAYIIKSDIELSDIMRILRQTLSRDPFSSTPQHDLREAYKKALADNQLDVARTKLKKLLRLLPNDKETLKQLKKLNIRIKRVVRKQIRLGNSLYTQGKYQKAKSVWKQALELDPYNAEIITQITRVDKILEKLKKLKSSS